MERKGFGPRLGAMLIDFVIVVVVSGIIGLVAGVGFSVRMGTGSTTPATGAAVSAGAFRLAGILGALFGLAYTSTEIFMAASPGKMILKMRITNQDGTVADTGKLITRWAIKNCNTLVQLVAVITGIAFLGTVAGLAGLFVFISCLMVLRATKLALHDDIAGTAVYGPGTAVVPGFQVMPPGSVPPPPSV